MNLKTQSYQNDENVEYQYLFDLCLVLGQDTLLSQCLSWPPGCIKLHCTGMKLIGKSGALRKMGSNVTTKYSGAVFNCAPEVIRLSVTLVLVRIWFAFLVL